MATTAAERPKQSSYQQRQADQKAIALRVNEPRLPYPADAAAKFDCPPEMWRALIDSTWPSARTVDGVLLALSWCKWRKLDPIKKPCHIVSIWSSDLGRNVESVWPSIAEVRITAHRTGQYAGVDDTVWGPLTTTVFEGDLDEWNNNQKSVVHKKVTLTHPQWAQVTVYKLVGGQPRKFVGPRVWYLANYGCIGKTDLPNEKWSEPGYQMLEKCAEAAALRKAFPEEIGDQHVAEEMEGRKFMDFGGGMSVAQPEQSAPPEPERSDFKDVGADGKVSEPEPEGHALIDETGVVVETYAEDAAYADAVVALFGRLTDLRQLETAAANNLGVLDKLPKALGRKAREAFDAAKARVSKSGDAPGATGQAAEPGRDAASGPSHPAAKFTARNARGRVIREGLDARAFAAELMSLFQAAEMIVDVEAIYRENADAIRALPEEVASQVAADYDDALKLLGPDSAR